MIIIDYCAHYLSWSSWLYCAQVERWARFEVPEGPQWVSREHQVLRPRRILGWIDQNKDLKIGQNSLSKSAMSNFKPSDFQLKTFRFNLPQNARQVEKSVTGVRKPARILYKRTWSHLHTFEIASVQIHLYIFWAAFLQVSIQPSGTYVRSSSSSSPRSSPDPATNISHRVDSRLDLTSILNILTHYVQCISSSPRHLDTSCFIIKLHIKDLESWCYVNL